MASLKFPDTGTRFVTTLAGKPATNATGYLYEDEALTVVAEVYADVNGTKGSLIPTDTDGRRSITLDAYGRQPDYWGPADGQDRLWIVINGVANPVEPDNKAQFDALQTRVTAIEDGGASDAAVVHKAGAETITGVKTFSAAPIVPDATNPGEAANLAVVDAAVDAEATSRNDADASVASVAASALTAHEADTTNIHGITNTALLETTSGAQAKADSAQAAAASDATSKVATEAALRVSGDAASVATAATDATTKANAAQAAAISTASTDATNKVAAEAALRVSGDAASVSTAATDATTKANAAQAAAIAASVQRASNLSDLASATTARSNLGLGDAAVKNTGTTAGTLAAGDDSRIVGAAQKSANLSDLSSAATARTNLGLGNVDNTSDANKPVSTAAAAALALKVATSSLPTLVAGAGIDPTGVVDSTAAITALLQSGPTKFFFPPGTYKLSIPTAGSLAEFVGVTGLYIDASQATFSNLVDYNSASFRQVFLLNGCTDSTIILGEYIGFALPNEAANIGLHGAMVVRAINQCRGVYFKAARITNARYGLQSGEYGDPTKGNCSRFIIDLPNCSHVGYPVVFYHAQDVTARVRVDVFDRAIYLAGVRGAEIDVRFQNAVSGGDTVVLITDALTGVGTSFGAADMRIRAEDTGSTTLPTSAMVFGISMSRVDPGTVFENLRLNLQVRGTDTLAHRIGAFRISSGATTIPGAPYPYDWEQTIYFRNIVVSGIIDRSSQTTSTESVGPIYVNTLATGGGGTHYATVSGLSFENLTIIPATSGGINARIVTPGLLDRVTFRNYFAPQVPIVVATNTSSELVFDNSTAGALTSDGTNTVTLLNSTLASSDDTATVFMKNINSTVAGAGSLVRSRQIETPTLSGTSVTLTAAIPAGSIVLGIAGRITQTITGATGYKVGISGDDARYVGSPNTAAGSTFSPTNAAASELYPRLYTANTNVLVGGLAGSTFTGGKIKIVIYYILMTAPTS